MAKTGRPTRAQRSSEVRAKWGAHVAAWKATGGRQSDYCRAQELDPKYFSIWKGRLERAAPAGVAPPTADTAATLVPVVIRASAPRRVIADRGSGEHDWRAHLSSNPGTMPCYIIYIMRSIA